MERLLVLLVLTVFAVGVAALLQRRRPEAPSAPSYRAPAQLDLADFEAAVGGSDSKLLVVFTSATCDSCAAVWKTVQTLASPLVTVQRVEIQSTPGLHKRYKIDGVPTTLIANDEGVVDHSYFGPVDADALKDALSE